MAIVNTRPANVSLADYYAHLKARVRATNWRAQQERATLSRQLDSSQGSTDSSTNKQESAASAVKQGSNLVHQLLESQKSSQPSESSVPSASQDQGLTRLIELHTSVAFWKEKALELDHQLKKANRRICEIALGTLSKSPDSDSSLSSVQ
jgi:Mg-chelatase subunit ChlI